MAEQERGGCDALDEQIRGLFEAVEERTPDKGFAESVVRSIRRHERLRLLVISLAAGIGVIIALTQLIGVAGVFSDQLMAFSGSLEDLSLPRQYLGAGVACLAALLTPVLVRLLDNRTPVL